MRRRRFRLIGPGLLSVALATSACGTRMSRDAISQGERAALPLPVVSAGGHTTGVPGRAAGGAETERSEARYVIEKIKEHVREGAAYRDFLVLYRTNAQSRVFEEGFLGEGIPYRVVGGVEALTGILMCGLSTGLFFAVFTKVFGLSRETSRAA